MKTKHILCSLWFSFLALVGLLGPRALLANALPALTPEGALHIDGSVTVSSAEEAARLSAATQLVLAEGATLTYTATEPLLLTANVSGQGIFAALNAGAVTLRDGAAVLTLPRRDFAFVSLTLAD
jgi:hypothetical protein